MIFWLDDMRDPAQYGAIGATWAKNYDEAINILKRSTFTFASLDHDLGACAECTATGFHIGDMKTAETTFFNRCPHEKSGYDVLCWMEEHNIWPQNGIRIHSMNPVGRQQMEQIVFAHYGRNF